MAAPQSSSCCCLKALERISYASTKHSHISQSINAIYRYLPFHYILIQSTTMSSSTNPLNENRPYSDTYEALQREAASLPVAKDMDRLIAAIKKYQVNIIVGETGSGKTTLLPKEMLLRGVVGRTKKIAVTQNRRMVAQAVSSIDSWHRRWRSLIVVLLDCRAYCAAPGCAAR